MLTGQNAEQDIIASLEAGANDYVIKLARLGELLARVKSQLWQHKASDTARFSIGGLSFLPANKLLKSEDETRKVILTEKESTILKYLYRAHPNCVTKEELLAEVWGFQNGLSTHTVETHLSITPEDQAADQKEYHPDRHAGLFTVIRALGATFIAELTLAGAVGFEPTIHDTKNRCLPLGYAPVAEWSQCSGQNVTDQARRCRRLADKFYHRKRCDGTCHDHMLVLTAQNPRYFSAASAASHSAEVSVTQNRQNRRQSSAR